MTLPLNRALSALGRRLGPGGVVLLEGLDRLVFPPPVHCLVCGREGCFAGNVCPSCVASWRRELENWCPRCGRPSSGAGAICGECASRVLPWDRVRPVGVYRGGLRELICRFKYGGERWLGLPLGEIMAGVAMVTLARPDLLAPVPLAPGRYRRRGFNQAEELARRMELLCPEGTGLLRQRVLIDPEDRFPKGDLGAKLVLLEKAVFSGTVVEIDYESPLCRTLSTRGPVDPYGLVNKTGYWFVVGYCHTLETYRAFNLVYIRTLTSTDRTFVRDETFSLDEFWERVKPK